MLSINPEAASIFDIERMAAEWGAKEDEIRRLCEDHERLKREAPKPLTDWCYELQDENRRARELLEEWCKPVLRVAELQRKARAFLDGAPSDHGTQDSE